MATANTGIMQQKVKVKQQQQKAINEVPFPSCFMKSRFAGEGIPVPLSLFPLQNTVNVETVRRIINLHITNT